MTILRCATGKCAIRKTIFGNERCVVSLDDLEVVAHAIYSKAVRDCTAREQISSKRGAEAAEPPERQSETSANPSTSARKTKAKSA